MSSWRDRPLCVLGATGSIGVNTLAVARELGIPVHSITGNRNLELLARQAMDHGVRRVVVAEQAGHGELAGRLADHPGIEVLAGPDALLAVAGDPNAPVVVTAIVGAAGLPATLAAVEAGKRVCIANKEPLVMAGHLIMAAARSAGAEILPVDSEHCAIHQCLAGHHPTEVERILLTASGGPCRDCEDLATVTPAEALRHPTWDMGPKITIDSATLMNKALECIEAHWLFDLPMERIEVLIHPQSVIHSMVAYRDGSTMAQLGLPDMRTPIQYCLTHPEHVPGPVANPAFTADLRLGFAAVDHARFPAVNLARRATDQGGLAPTALNIANEVAVDRFLAGRIAFTEIYALVERGLELVDGGEDPDLPAILATDAMLRERL